MLFPHQKIFYGLQSVPLYQLTIYSLNNSDKVDIHFPHFTDKAGKSPRDLASYSTTTKQEHHSEMVLALLRFFIAKVYMLQIVNPKEGGI